MTGTLQAVVLGAFLLSPVLGAPGVSTVESRQDAPKGRWSGGGVTILSDNRLDNSPKNGSDALLVHQLTSYTAAVESCKVLGEGLWNPDTANFADGLNSSLSYQAFTGTISATQLFWVDSGNPTNCRAADVHGKITPSDCTIKLPVLCTQSAPVSTQANNTATDYMVDHLIGSQVYTGYRDAYAWKFRAIHYAAQPTRFEHSTLFQPNETTPIPALTSKADCLQRVGEVQRGSGEDCLFLNVWTPLLPLSNASQAVKPSLKPVMFYIYGGGFTSGTSNNGNADGTNLASRGDVVVVTPNYRVSTLGWMAFDDGVHNGNYGLGDIINALIWVQKNIKDLGGDPTRVTIFGESAGAMLVRALLASPKAHGLFYAAISMSGPTGLSGNEHGSTSYYNSIASEFAGTSKSILQTMGCWNVTDQIACMRSVNATELIYINAISSSLVVDGALLTSNTLALNHTHGYTRDVAFMTGMNRDELGVDVDPIKEGANITDIFARQLPGGVGDLSRFLTSSTFAPANSTPTGILNATIRASTNGLYTCLEQATAYTAARHNAFRAIYSFEFNRTYSPPGYTKPHCDAPKTADRPNGDPDAEYYKCHAGEKMVVFGNVRRAGLPDRDGLDVPFMQLSVDYWSAFARTRDPNPDRAYLQARGYWGTLEQIAKVGPWVAAKEGGWRLLQWDGRQQGVTEKAQCDALGLPIDYFETR